MPRPALLARRSVTRAVSLQRAEGWLGRRARFCPLNAVGTAPDRVTGGLDDQQSGVRAERRGQGDGPGPPPAQYEEMYARSISDPDGFWREQASGSTGSSRSPRSRTPASSTPNVSIKWFEDGVLNLSANCIDRHLEKRGDQVAIIWEGDTPRHRRQDHLPAAARAVCRFANVLKTLGVRKGDRVTIYLPMIPEAAYAMLACARIGAVHSVVFGGFSPDALAGRINDCDSRVVDHRRRGPARRQDHSAQGQCRPGARGLPRRREGAGGREHRRASRHEGRRDVWWHEAAAGVEPFCDPEPMNAEDPLFILYTSGSTGKPKGVLHTTGGYRLGLAHPRAHVRLP
jgi:acetyl-CoA synthetase